QAQEELEGLTLKAPIDGLVVYNEVWGPSGRQKVKAGDTPWPGQSIIEIPDLASMYVKTSVNEVDINRLDVGQQVIIKVDALPDLTLYGKVSRIATLARLEKGTNTKVFDVDVTIEGTNPNLKPGMTASCQIITDRIPDALYVPVESVFEKEGKTVVYVLTSSAKSREVEVGQKNSDYIVIKKGLKEGERVTLRDPTKPLEELGGEAPKVQEKKGKPKKRRSEGVIIYY
ncbi:MAG: efflux RND transporter periplasmic adaptor subunit, partial [Candidatus Zixiibacteriota bacterium]